MQKALFPISKTWQSQGMNEGSHTGTLAIDFGILNPYNVTELTAPFDGTIVHVDPQSMGGGIAFQSDEKVQYVNGTVDYMTLWTGHDNNPPKVGSKFKQGEVYSHMGTAGGVAKHCHLEVQIGKFIMPTKTVKTPYGYVYKLDNALEPFKALFLHADDLIKYTTYTWVRETDYVGTPVARDETKDQIEVVATVLNARKKPSLSGDRLGFVNPGIYNILGTKKADNYLWYEIEKDMWIAYNKDWENLLPKKESEIDILKKELEAEKKLNAELKTKVTTLESKIKEIDKICNS